MIVGAHFERDLAGSAQDEAAIDGLLSAVDLLIDDRSALDDLAVAKAQDKVSVSVDTNSVGSARPSPSTASCRIGPT